MSAPEVLEVRDHGVWRGRRRWTVRVDGPTGRAAVEAIDVDTAEAAVAQALETYASRRVFTPAERAALGRSSSALRRGLL